MFRIVLLTGIAALSTTAIAQETPDPAAGSAATTPPAAESSQTPPSPDASSPSPDPAGQPSARPATPAEVGGLVQSEFPNRDRDGNGKLDQAEFSSWLSELVSRSPDGSSGNTDAQIASAFGSSDTDGDGAISAEEMTALLARSR